MNILATGNPIEDRHLTQLQAEGHTVHFFRETLDETALKRALTDCDAWLFGGDEYASAAALSEARYLKCISILAAGYESFMDMPTIQKLGISVTNTPGANANSVAEFLVTQLLTLWRRVPELSIDREKFSDSNSLPLLKSVQGKSIGIVGMGHIGKAAAVMLQRGFGASICYWNRTRKPEIESSLKAQYLELHSLFRGCDAIIVAIPESESTQQLINENLISKMKEGSILASVARPSVVDPEALLKGMKSGRIYGAAFDHWYSEKSSTLDALLKFAPARLVITPHVAWFTRDASQAMADMATASLLNALSNGEDSHLVVRGNRLAVE